MRVFVCGHLVIEAHPKEHFAKVVGALRPRWRVERASTGGGGPSRRLATAPEADSVNRRAHRSAQICVESGVNPQGESRGERYLGPTRGLNSESTRRCPYV